MGAPAPYVRAPDRFIRRFAHDPLAVGVYLAVARFVIAERGPVPLSPTDLAAWSGRDRIRDLAIMRRIRRLVETGWLIAERGRAVKLRLMPTWGIDNDGAVLPWRPNDDQFGKPDRVRVRRVPLELLDGYIGRLDPQPGRIPALVTRYVEQPLIDLIDLGTYAIASIDPSASTETLRALHLLDEAGPCPPRPVATLRTQESAAAETAPETTAEIDIAEANGSPNGSLIGSPNGSPNGSDPHHTTEGRVSAPGATTMEVVPPPATNTWDSWDQRTHGTHGIPTPSSAAAHGGGGGRFHPELKQREPARALDPERERLLVAMGIRQRSALADVPMMLIEQWQAALAHSGLAARFVDPPAFAVAQLRLGNSPPDQAELERWARPMEYQSAARRSAFPQSPYTPVAVDLERHEALLTQMQAIAGTCDALTQSYVFSALEAGKSATEALAYAQTEVAAMHAIDSEEVYRALRARSAR